MAQLSPEYAKKDGAAAGGNGQQLCPFEQTKGAVHNLCLSTLNYECQHDWSGHVIKEYPLVIKNGDCGRFDHEGKFGVGSIGAVVYRGKDFDWLLAWSNRPSDKMCPVAKDQVYTEIAERGTCWNWDVIKEKLDKGGSSAKCHFKDYGAILKITQCPSANLEATISIINPF